MPSISNTGLQSKPKPCECSDVMLFCGSLFCVAVWARGSPGFQARLCVNSRSPKKTPTPQISYITVNPVALGLINQRRPQLSCKGSSSKISGFSGHKSPRSKQALLTRRPRSSFVSLFCPHGTSGTIVPPQIPDGKNSNTHSCRSH